MKAALKKYLSIPGRSISGMTARLTISGFVIVLIYCGCEKDYQIDIKANRPQLVVEGYINNEMRQMNYVVLTRSLDYYNPDFKSTAVTGADVTITEGAFDANGGYSWDASTKVQLLELNLPQIPANFRQGIYFDPRLITDSARSLIGKAGKSYLLEIETGGQHYSAIASILQPVAIDSLTCGFSFADTDDDNKEKARITIHFQDPDTLGNSQLFYWRDRYNRNNFGWGGIGFSGRNYGVDDLSNGEYLHITQNHGFEIGDTITFHMASATRAVYDFWQNFRDARNNEGPFSTPVSLMNKIQGDNVTGCFSGFSLSSKSVVVYK